MEGISPVAAQAAQGGLAQELQPMQAGAMQDYYTGTAGLQDAFMRAQAQGGLGWTNTMPGLTDLKTRNIGLISQLMGIA